MDKYLPIKAKGNSPQPWSKKIIHLLSLYPHHVWHLYIRTRRNDPMWYFCNTEYIWSHYELLAFESNHEPDEILFKCVSSLYNDYNLNEGGKLTPVCDYKHRWAQLSNLILATNDVRSMRNRKHIKRNCHYKVYHSQKQVSCAFEYTMGDSDTLTIQIYAIYHSHS